MLSDHRSQRIGSFPDRNRLIATRMAYGWHFSGGKLMDHIESRRILRYLLLG